MSSTLLSCGLLVINERDELLVGHSTGSSHWDLPKGLIDPGETPLGCALREAREEFGLDFDPACLTDLGRHAYYRGKDLHLFAVRTDSRTTRPEECRCASFFDDERSGRRLREIDAYGWADEEALALRLAGSMKRLLLAGGLLARVHTALLAAPA